MKTQPLQGVRVLDLTQIYQGPYATFLMAMAGAEVVKVEPPTGELMRRGGGTDTPLAFAMLNSNKKSLKLNLKQQRAKELLLEMAAKSDVLVENFAPGAMDRLGLGWEVMHRLNPRLIYATSTGYGVTGPDRDQLAMDHTVQASSGIMSQTGERGGPPARTGGQVVDIMGGIHLYGGIVTALLAREKTGVGTQVEIAMAEAAYFALSSEYSYYHRTGELPERRGDKSATPTAPYGRYQCSDGWVALICVNEGQWQNLTRLIGREDLIDNPDYKTSSKRHDHEAEVNRMIEGWTMTRTRHEVFQQAKAVRVPIAPVRDLKEVMADKHMRERGMLHDMHHPYMGDVVLPSSPIRFSEYEASALSFFPELGANGAEALKEWLSMSEAEIQALADDDVI